MYKTIGSWIATQSGYFQVTIRTVNSTIPTSDTKFMLISAKHFAQLVLSKRRQEKYQILGPTFVHWVLICSKSSPNLTYFIFSWVTPLPLQVRTSFKYGPFGLNNARM